MFYSLSFDNNSSPTEDYTRDLIHSDRNCCELLDEFSIFQHGVNILNRQTNQIATTSGKLLITCLTIVSANLVSVTNNLNAAPISPIAVEPELEINVTGNRKLDLPKSTPVYTIDSQQIDRQGSKNVADVLNNLPGFSINNSGYGADIHTGTYYRGASINQFTILLNGRPISNTINTYHGATDLNSIPADAITYGRLRQRSD
jgi:outer membrane receptor for ferrienterochelin and colicin